MGVIKDIPVEFAKQSYQSRSKPISSQRLVNLYVESNPPDSKEPLVLIGTPGNTVFSSIGTGAIYGMRLMGSLLYVVSGDNVYKVDSAGTKTLLGSMGTVSDNVSMDDNGTHVIIVKADGAAYVADSSSLTQITDVDFQSAGSVTVLDFYAIFNKLNTSQYFISAVNDATAYDVLEIKSAEEESDNLVRVYEHRGELWLFGQLTTEIHYDAASGDFPFQKIQGASLERGCAAKLSVADENNVIYWLGDDLIVYMAKGYSPERISTHAMEKAVGGYTTTSDAHAFIYTQEGHKFYVLTFPTALASWVYDITTGLWHERETFEKSRWLASSFAYAFGKNLVGDFETGKIYELGLDVYTENGTTIQRIATSPTFYNNTKLTTFDRFELDVDAGVGLITGQGSDPQIMLDWSEDGGNTWKGDDWRSMGAIGEYETMTVWDTLGQSRSRIFRITVTDPVKVAIHGARADIRVGLV